MRLPKDQLNRQRPYQGSLSLFATLAMLVMLAAPGLAQGETDSVEELKSLAFEDLFDVEVTSVSKRSQKLSRTAAAVTVLSGEDIRRSGHTSIPEALRMVPGLEVAQIDGNKWAITARGFNNQFAQKLLVLIDGRSVYTPLFSGVYWDVQDVLMEDIDRIEVIRGPGGTVWGANAVNGVINIITKSAKETHGILAQAGGGTVERGFGALRYGGSKGDLHYRVYGKGMHRAELDQRSQSGGGSDDWWIGRGGFRMDWDASEQDNVTFQGDFYEGETNQRFRSTAPITTGNLRGLNLLGRWTRKQGDASQLSVQMFYDHTERRESVLEEERNTFDAELQYDFDITDDLHTTAGLNYRVHDVELQSTFIVSFTPDQREDHLVAGFVQGELALLDDRLFVTAGSKFEYNEFSGFEYQPSLRAAWQPLDRFTVWGAISRAVRTPSQSDQDLRIVTPTGPTTVVTQNGDDETRSVDLLAVEMGIRGNPIEHLTFDLAAFYFEYEDLITRQALAPIVTPPFTEFPTTTTNQLEGMLYGAELEVEWRPTERFFVSAAYSVLEIKLNQDGPVTGDDPRDVERSSPAHQIKLRSGVNLPYDFEIDATIQFVDGVPAQVDSGGDRVGSYWRGDLRLGWRPSESVSIDLVGQNLFARQHAEFGGTSVSPTLVPRSVYARATLRY
ncbi:MAG: TonB-dependent receptor plug domain-containing protein [Myxococcota bacterium]